VGKAKIVSGGSGGKYNIELVFDTARATARVAAITKRLEELPGLITAQEVIVNNARVKADSDEYDLTQVITAFNAGTKTFSDIQSSTETMVKSEGEWTAATKLLASLKLETTSLTMEKDRLENLMTEVLLDDIWCADLTENLAAGASVGTVELNGELCDDPIIMPGGTTGKGQLQPTFSGTPAGTFFNWALLPWWQKRRPTYRAGVITAIDYEADTCSVTLLDAKSSELGQGLDINEEDLDGWTDVPIVYLTCNSQAFAVGDDVLVELVDQDWDKPRVIGFIHDPKPCELPIYLQMRLPVADSAFYALAMSRLDDLHRDQGYADYCKNTFVQQVCNHWDSLVGKYISMEYGFPFRIFEQADSDRLKQPWIQWRDSKGGINSDIGYNTYTASINAKIALWYYATYLPNYMENYLYFRHIEVPGDLGPAPETLIKDGPIWKIDCDKVLPQSQILNPSGGTAFQKSRNASLATQTLWTALDVPSIPKSKVYNCLFTVTGIITFYFQARGVIDSDQMFYVLSRQYSCSLLGPKPPDNIVVTVSVGNGELFSYPSPNNYSAMFTSLTGSFSTDNGIEASMRMKGSLPNIPTSFGGYIQAPTLDGMLIKDYGGPKADDPFSWVGRFLRKITKVPEGFEFFAGRYPDHPIVTGADATTPLTLSPGQEAATLNQVQAYVTAKYPYVADGTNEDEWTFLSDINPSGDCEDMALTKIQLLLEAGFSISRLRLQTGVKYVSYEPKIYDANGVEILKTIGHVWLLVDSNTVLDSAGPVKGLGNMSEWQERMTQRGLIWTVDATGETYTAIPWPHTAFNNPVMTMRIRKHTP